MKITRKQLKKIIKEEAESFYENNLMELGDEESIEMSDEKKQVQTQNKRALENNLVDKINDLINTRSAYIYSEPHNNSTRKEREIIEATGVQMPHPGEKWGGSASISFGREDYISFSPSEIKVSGYYLPGSSYNYTDKDGFHTMIGVIKLVVDNAGFWDSSQKSQIINKAISHFKPFIVDTENLEVSDRTSPGSIELEEGKLELRKVIREAFLDSEIDSKLDAYDDEIEEGTHPDDLPDTGSDVKQRKHNKFGKLRRKTFIDEPEPQPLRLGKKTFIDEPEPQPLRLGKKDFR